MSDHDNRTISSSHQLFPASVLGGMGLLILAAGVWIITTGDVFDGRHLLGSFVAIICGISFLVQAVGRAGYRPDPAPVHQLSPAHLGRQVHSGTWRRPADSTEIWVGWLPARGMFVVGGACALVGVQPGLIGRLALQQALSRAQAQGWSPTREAGTQAIRRLLLMETPNLTVRS